MLYHRLKDSETSKTLYFTLFPSTKYYKTSAKEWPWLIKGLTLEVISLHMIFSEYSDQTYFVLNHSAIRTFAGFEQGLCLLGIIKEYKFWVFSLLQKYVNPYCVWFLAMQYIHIVWLCGRIMIGSNFICLAEVISNKDFISFLYSIFFLIFGAISPSGPALSWIITEDMRQANFLGAYTIFLGGFVASPHPRCSKAKVWKKSCRVCWCALNKLLQKKYLSLYL